MSRIFRDLAPYHEAVAAEYRDAFLPPLRPATLHYEVGGQLRQRSNQFMYGRDLIVAAADDSGMAEAVNLELPDDQWIHLWSSRRFGGGPVSVETQPGCPAVFWRSSTVFAELFDSIRRGARKR